ncbi:phosphoenolpyruvate carboxylase family protein, partial [Vibrio parahaemolyticus V-223/04]
KPLTFISMTSMN